MKSNFSIPVAVRVMAAVYALFIISMVAYAFHQHQILYHPRNLHESAEAVLEDTNALHDLGPGEYTPMNFDDSSILNHSQIPENGNE